MTELIYQKIISAIRRHEMICGAKKVCVALSGGPDSTFLLILLNDLKGDLGIELSICHINHGLRGEESEEDARFARSLAEKLEIPIYLEKVDVEKERLLNGGSTQAAARELRYRVFERLLAEGRADKVATAHTADDAVETLLINFLRGSGPKGLAGIPPVRNGNIIRPIIELEKEDVLKYLREQKIDYRIDSSNEKNNYLRNEIRNSLIPQLERDFNPNLKQTLRRTAEILSDLQAHMENEANEAFVAIEQGGGSDEVVIDNARFAGLDIALQREVMKLVVTKVRGNSLGISFGNFESLCRLACSSEGSGEISLPGLRATVSHGKLFCNSQGFRTVKPFSYQWIGNGSVAIVELDCNVQIEQVETPLPSIEEGGYVAYVDADSIPADSEFRNRREGDRFNPLGGAGSQKLKKYLIDRKISRWERDSILLLVAGSEVLWIAGQRLSESVRVTRDTSKIFRIETSYGVKKDEKAG